MANNIKAEFESRNEIWVTDFNMEAALKFREQMVSFSDDNENKPIIIRINSYGGAVDALASMVATIEETHNPIITVAQGCAMSCGAILLSHGDIRFCDPHSRVLIHRVSSGTCGDTEDMTNDAKEVARLNEYWMNILAVNCHIKDGYKGLKKIFKEHEGRDIYLTAEEAKEFGIVDAIGLPKVAAVTLYEVIDGPKKIPIEKRAALRAKNNADSELLTRKPGKKKTRRKTTKTRK